VLGILLCIQPAIGCEVVADVVFKLDFEMESHCYIALDFASVEAVVYPAQYEDS
jgi:hypothetical protein